MEIDLQKAWNLTIAEYSLLDSEKYFKKVWNTKKNTKRHKKGTKKKYSQKKATI